MIFSALFLLAFASLGCASNNSAHSVSPTLTPPASSLILKDIDGDIYDIDSLTSDGKLVVLSFWQTWCASCRYEAPHLVRAARRHAPNIKFFGIVPGGDPYVDLSRVRELREKWGLFYPQIRDLDIRITRKYKVVGVPTVILLGAGNRVLFRGRSLPRDLSR